MGGLAALRFKLIFAWTFLMRKVLSYSAGNNLAALTIPFIHPGIKKQQPAFNRGLKSVLQNKSLEETAWDRHKALVGVTRFQGSFYAQKDISWINKCQLHIHGAEHIQNYHQSGNGVLVMTYHHHFNMLFCNLLGRLELPVTTIAMDDSGNNARFQKFGSRVRRIYQHAEKLLNGGDIILVKPQRQVRSILRALDKNHLVITANDFPGFFEDKNRKDFTFLNTKLSCPTGTVKLAVKKNIPIVAAYLIWQGGSHFDLVIKPVCDGVQEVTIDEAMKRYLNILEDAIRKEPGMWEGWKWIK